MKKIFLLWVSTFALWGSLCGAAEPARPPIAAVRNSYVIINAGTTAWVPLIASLPSSASVADIFDSSGQTLEIGVGASTAEQRVLIIPPGGNNGPMPVLFNAGDRISIRSLTGTANAGEIDLNIWQ